MKFKIWLVKQVKKGKKGVLRGPALDFAVDVKRDTKWKEPRHWDDLESYVAFRSRGDLQVMKAAQAAYIKWQETDPKATVDGLGPNDKRRLRIATRAVWRFSYSRKLCVDRATDSKGYGRCEKCNRRCPKVFVDHITPVGKLDEGYLLRLFCPSPQLQGLCRKCHNAKTKEERARERDGF